MLTRRDLLKVTAASGVMAATAPLTLAAVPTDQRLVIVNIRGGVDGLALVPAPGDPNFNKVRGQLVRRIERREGKEISLDGFFTLHGALTGLEPLWKAKQLAVVHAAQTGYRNRSHFDAQAQLENGLNHVSKQADGWLNRMLSFFGSTQPRLGLALGPTTPHILRGATPIASWSPRLLPRPKPTYLEKLAALSDHDDQLGSILREGIKTDQLNYQLLNGQDQASVISPTSREGLTTLARAAGKLLAAKTGARIAALDIGGLWDTHGHQRLVLTYRVPILNDTLMALKMGLGSAWRQTVVIVVTEFRRTVAPNGTRGTDHGTASAALLLGGAVRGGRVIADWPGLTPTALYEGRDLRPTTDLRAVFKSVLGTHLHIDRGFIEDHVFPESRSIEPMEPLVVG